jgi:glycosyltransferase involved in cell wall biosynthesis
MKDVFFSIIIPMYNREQVIARAIDSCLNQDFDGFELIVVDDGSTDGSALIANANANDPRFCLIQHIQNRGVCPTRNTGVEHARGEWIVFLDSDDELLPGALTTLFRRIKEAPADVDRISGMYRWDDGTLSPFPASTGQVLDYEGYILWSAKVGRSDFHNCIRRTTFDSVRLPENRALEHIYHLDFASYFKTWMLTDVIALEHQDAKNNTLNLRLGQKSRGILRDAADSLWAVEQLLKGHGESLRRLDFATWRLFERTRVLQALLSGKRLLGCRYGIAYFRQFGFCAGVLLALFLGLLGRQPLSWAQALRRA